MRVGLNLVYLVEGSGGSGTYARELIPSMLAVEPQTRITAFVSREVPRSVTSAPWAEEVEWVKFPIDITHGPPYNMALTMGSQWGAIPILARRRRLDVLHGLANIVPPVSPGVATVVTLLDLIWLRFPNTMERRATIGMKLVAPFSARHAGRVIAISEAARRDLVESIRLDPAKVDVTYLGVRAEPLAEPKDTLELRRQLDLGDAHVVLCIAQKREHKNLDGLIRAVAQVPDVVLVLVGSPTPYERTLKELAAELGVADRVRFPGWLQDEELESLYRLSSCFVLPSFEEGFGLPILEAMARDLPVACSNATSLPEVAGDAALLFDPRRPDEIAGAIQRIVSDRDLAQTLVERGRVRCRQFTWEATARATLATYRRAIARS